MCVHNTGIVEDDIETTPGIERFDGGLNLSLLGDIANLNSNGQSTHGKIGDFWGDFRRTMVSTRFAPGTNWVILALAFSRAGSEISVIRMLAPSLANRMHVSRPIPLEHVSQDISLYLPLHKIF
jgi:hypothetical protein